MTVGSSHKELVMEICPRHHVVIHHARVVVGLNIVIVCHDMVTVAHAIDAIVHDVTDRY